MLAEKKEHKIGRKMEKSVASLMQFVEFKKVLLFRHISPKGPTSSLRS